MNATGHASAARIFYDTVRKEGIFTLYRGWVPAYFRLGPHAMICFPIFEQLRKLFGLSYL
jgi:dicarboxylate transporter 10